MGLKQIANGKAREYVLKREPFKGSNLFADTNEHGMYAVYSFGYHHPLFVYDGLAEQWYENMTYASRTTSKHRTQTRPNGEDMIPLHLKDMLVVARHGAVGLIEVAGSTEQSFVDMVMSLTDTSAFTRPTASKKLLVSRSQADAIRHIIMKGGTK